MIVNSIRRIFTNRIRFSFFIFGIFLLEDILEKVGPHSIFGDIWGVIGVLLISLGLFIRSWAAGILIKEKKLATFGPYAIMRHPLYFGSFLMALGFCIKIGDTENIWIVLFLLFFVYLPKIRLEERILSRKFGRKWQTYVRRTAMFYPRRFNFSWMNCNWSIDMWFKNREYNAVIGVVIGLFLTELIHYFFPNWLAH